MEHAGALDGVVSELLPGQKNKTVGQCDYSHQRSSSLLSDIVTWQKYARFLQSEQRKEVWEEIVHRNELMHMNKYPHLKERIEEAYRFVYDKRILPSMRSMQYAGIPITMNPARIYNCSYVPINDWRVFSEILLLLMSGCGVGYSVRKHHINQLPVVTKPDGKQRFLVADTLEGWVDAVRALTRAYFLGRYLPIFDFSDVRPMGAPLKTSGGRAPGPGPLMVALHNLNGLFVSKQIGDRLSSLECHDAACYISEAVHAGGLRSAAMISLFDEDDMAMVKCKHGDWSTNNKQRARANNSVSLYRPDLTRQSFFKIFDNTVISGSGEPGFALTNDRSGEYGLNPCGEIGLRPNQFCNLCEVNVSDVHNQSDLNERVRAAAFIGTLQAGYTDFHYLRGKWKKTTEDEALIGVGLTGICSGRVLDLDLERAARVVLDENENVAKAIGINTAARTTCVKPSGNSSCVLGCSSGVHSWHDEFYVRRIRITKSDEIYKFLFQKMSLYIEDDLTNKNTAILSLPQAAPPGSILRNESPIDALERVKKIYNEWVIPGHRSGVDTNNVSCTIYVKDNEWGNVGQWMWSNRNCYRAISLLPYDGGTYSQMPYETISKDKYIEMMSNLSTMNMKNIVESEDNTSFSGEVACAGGACLI